MKQIYLQPTQGRQVPDPYQGGYLPAEGGWVTDNPYWRRRLNEGAVIESQPPAAPISQATAESEDNYDRAL